MPELVGELAGDLSGARLFYIGAFPERRIAGQPAAWTVSPAAGRFTLQVPDGSWYIHAVGVPAPQMGFPNGITWGSHGGIYGFGRPVNTDGADMLQIALSPLWRDVTHVPLHLQPALTDDQWQAVIRGMETLAHDLSSSVEGDAAYAAGLARTRFSALFKRGTGLSPEEYRMRVRLEASKALLVETDRDVLEVALEVGYSTPAQLGRLFQRYLGVAPGEFRRLARMVGRGGGAGAPPSSPSARWARAATICWPATVAAACATPATCAQPSLTAAMAMWTPAEAWSAGTRYPWNWPATTRSAVSRSKWWMATPSTDSGARGCSAFCRTAGNQW